MTSHPPAPEENPAEAPAPEERDRFQEDRERSVLFENFKRDSLNNATTTRDVLREMGIRTRKWAPFWWTFEDPEMEDLYTELCIRTSCRRMWIMAVALVAIVAVVFAIQVPSRWLLHGPEYFTFIEVWSFYFSFAGSLVILLGMHIEKKRFQKKTCCPFMAEETQEKEQAEASGVVDIEGVGGWGTAVVPSEPNPPSRKSSPQGSLPLSAQESAMQTNNNQTDKEETGSKAGNGAGGGGGKKMRRLTSFYNRKSSKASTGPKTTSMGRSSHTEGPLQGDGGSFQGWKSREEWEEWKGGSLDGEVRQHWKTLYIVGVRLVVQGLCMITRQQE
uniref:Uncharacterized protein n=1 Tax=Chromera velia CCMP2878 TaxID=1169474 RepID=A0A0G4IFH8_9ALVE|eukprot:Cvel_13906.t1-p1 / transcript=Cvel_13906.t1 / gene=Cvel_13906 / organism=Chromera_velia_CCMP2878 / gene_product=hypothetical protein / transcript_product=hypothetical protein / location=Cvel_scaffold969:17634-20286(-) / protein_length=330 / sequence_SO=supercontig / SO=protein_coding / is_pseudo=false